MQIKCAVVIEDILEEEKQLINTVTTIIIIVNASRARRPIDWIVGWRYCRMVGTLGGWVVGL